ELQFIPSEDGIVKLLDVLCFRIFTIQQQFRKDTSRLDSSLDQFDDNCTDIILIIIKIDKGIEFILTANVIVFEVKKVQMAGSVIAVHVAKTVVIERVIGFSIQNIFPAFVKKLDRDVILIKVIDHVGLPYLLYNGLFGE